MINIRKGTFETNSSSSHSLVVFKESRAAADDESWRFNGDGELHFYDPYELEFGRSPFELLTDWYGRLRYAIASCPDRIEEIEAACHKNLPWLITIKYPKERWSNEDTPYYGYVDHQSAGLLQSFLNMHNITLEEFIFNNKYMVVIDGDEYCVFDTLRHTPAWNEDGVEEVYG